MNYYVKIIINNNPIKLLYGFCAPTEMDAYPWREKRISLKSQRIYSTIITPNDKDEFINSLTALSPICINDISLTFNLEKGANSITTTKNNYPVGNSYALTEYWQKDKVELLEIIENNASDRFKQKENRKQAFELIQKEFGIDLSVNSDRLGNFDEYDPLGLYDSFEVGANDNTVTISKKRQISENLSVSCENRIAGRLVGSFHKIFDSNSDQIKFDFSEVTSDVTVKIWDTNGELVYIIKSQLILKIGVNFNLMQNRTVNDRWSKKLEKSSNELKEDIDKVKNFQISSSDKNTPIINNEPIWKHYYNEGRQIEFSFRQSQTKGCFIPKVSSKKGEIDSFLKIKEYIEETNVRKVIVADPFFSIVSSEKFMARISRSDVEILIITSLTDIDPDTGSNIDILTQYKKHLRLNSNILHKNTEIYNVAHSGNQAFHDRYLIRYFDDNTIDGFMLSNSLNSAGQNYSFVVAPLEKEVCFSVEEYLNKLIDINYQSNKPKLERLSIEKIFPLNNPVNNKKPIKNTLLFPSFISGEKDSESALKYCVEKGFIDEIKDNEHYTTRNDNWKLLIDAVISKWDKSPKNAAYALGEALYHSVFNYKPFEIIANNTNFSDKLIAEIKRTAPIMEQQQKHKSKETHSNDYILWAFLNGQAKPGSMFRVDYYCYHVFYSGKNAAYTYLYEYLLYKDNRAFMELLNKTTSPLMLSLLFQKVGIGKFDKSLYKRLIDSKYEFLRELGAKWLYDSEDKKVITNTISELNAEKALEQAIYLVSEIVFTIRRPKSDLTKWTPILFFLQGRITGICNQENLAEDKVLTHLNKLNDTDEESDANLKALIARELINEKYKNFLYDKIIKRYKSKINRSYSPLYNKEADKSYLELVLESLNSKPDDCNNRIIRILHWDLLSYYTEPYVKQYNYFLWHEAKSKISWDIALLDLYKAENELKDKLEYYYRTIKHNGRE